MKAGQLLERIRNIPPDTEMVPAPYGFWIHDGQLTLAFESYEEARKFRDDNCDDDFCPPYEPDHPVHVTDPWLITCTIPSKEHEWGFWF